MTAVGVIPARYASTRFPGKPLALIRGVPMIERVYRGCVEASSLDEVRIATDDSRIAEACAAFGAPVEMTRADHASGSDRLAEVAERLDCEIVVNIQGDEPLIVGYVIDAAVKALREAPSAVLSTLAHRAPREAWDDPNRVKVVTDRNGRALYFSRSAIPFARDPEGEASLLQHVGLYAYRREFLARYAEFAPTPLELTESLEQLRVLENGFEIAVAEIEGWSSCPVDVPEDIARVEALLDGS